MIVSFVVTVLSLHVCHWSLAESATTPYALICSICSWFTRFSHRTYVVCSEYRVLSSSSSRSLVLHCVGIFSVESCRICACHDSQWSLRQGRVAERDSTVNTSFPLCPRRRVIPLETERCEHAEALPVPPSREGVILTRPIYFDMIFIFLG